MSGAKTKKYQTTFKYLDEFILVSATKILYASVTTVFYYILIKVPVECLLSIPVC